MYLSEESAEKFDLPNKIWAGSDEIISFYDLSDARGYKG